MTDAVTAGGVRPLERWLLCLEEPPWVWIYRAVIGFLTFPAASALMGGNASLLSLTAFFLGILFTVRFGPAVLRRLLPLSSAVLETWAKRRRIAKRYDSYQWQKLFWYGVGLEAQALAFDDRFQASQMALASLCLVFGLIGLLRWRAGGARTTSTKLSGHAEVTPA
jgi:hypothetical protein